LLAAAALLAASVAVPSGPAAAEEAAAPESVVAPTGLILTPSKGTLTVAWVPFGTVGGPAAPTTTYPATHTWVPKSGPTAPNYFIARWRVAGTERWLNPAGLAAYKTSDAPGAPNATAADGAGFIDASAGNSYTITGLDDGTEYEIWLRGIRRTPTDADDGMVMNWPASEWRSVIGTAGQPACVVPTSNEPVSPPNFAPQSVPAESRICLAATADITVESTDDLRVRTLALPPGVAIEPAFRPDHFDYTITVPADMEHLDFVGGFITPFRWWKPSTGPHGMWYTAYLWAANAGDNPWGSFYEADPGGALPRGRWADMITPLHPWHHSARRFALSPGEATNIDITVSKWPHGRMLGSRRSDSTINRVYSLTVTRAQNSGITAAGPSVSFGDAAVSLLGAVDRVWTVGARVDRLGMGTLDGGGDALPEADVVVPPGASKFELVYSAAGLPEGLSMGNDRVIRGTPVAATDGEVTVTFAATGRAVDADGNQIGEAATASLEFGVTVMPPVVFDPASLSFFTNAILEYTVGQAAPLNVAFPAATGGEGPLEYWLDNRDLRVPIGSYAQGLSYDPATPALTSRTGNEEPEAGQSYALTYWAEDRNGARAAAYGSVTVAAPPTLPEIADKAVTVGQQVSLTLPEATGGSNRQLQLQYRMEPQIPGLSFNPRTRTLSGAPTLTGRALLTYSVSDRNGVSGSATFALEVAAGASAPAAPQISARALPASGVAAVDWDDVDGATGYVVQLRAADAEYPSFAVDSVPDQATLHVPPARIQNDDGSWTRTVVFGLSDGTYKVRVAAVNAHGAGPWSHEAGLTLPAALDDNSAEPEFYSDSSDEPDADESSQQPQATGEVPGPVTALELTATAGSVTVSWQPPEVGEAPGRYIVHLRPEGGRTGSGKTKNPKAKKTEVVFGDLKPGVIYHVWVRAQNEAGKGERVSATITLPQG
jgi:hypothetical protein